MINITPQEIDDMMDWLSNFSDVEGKGTTRLLYSPSWLKAQKELEQKFLDLQMEVAFDKVGNLFGTYLGKEEPEKIIASGSHIDTVVSGGRLDGQLGVMAAYLAIKKLVEKFGQPKKSLRVISMAEEEGSRFPYVFWGSKNIFGIQDNKDVVDIADSQGVKFVDAMHQAGFDFNEGEPQFNNMDAFLELHIEQGNFLEQTKKKVGIVNAIVGQRRYTIVLKGEANHAGTTLMKYRKDTIECFARIVNQSIDKAKAIGDPLVLTFGRVEATPNTVNVVPGETLFSMDCRHTDQQILATFTDEIIEDMKRIAKDMNIQIDVDMWMDEPPVPMDEGIVQVIKESCDENQLNYQLMHSGAGHDSQIFAANVPTAMIFVPSIKGISHNPEEHTEASDILEGILALATALYKLAY